MREKLLNLVAYDQKTFDRLLTEIPKVRVLAGYRAVLRRARLKSLR